MSRPRIAIAVSIALLGTPFALTLSGCGGGAKSTSSGSAVSSPAPNGKNLADDKKKNDRPRALGEACKFDGDEAETCNVGLFCAPTPGGYCFSFCGATGAACGAEAVCAETGTSGEFCLKACSSNADCRADEGYVCDPEWRGCVIPGITALKAPTCTQAQLSRTLFGPSKQVTTSASPGRFQFEPSAVVLPNGDIAVLYVAGDKIGAKNSLGVALVAAGNVALDSPFVAANENHAEPRLAIDKSGTLHATWLGFDDGLAGKTNMQVGYATSRDAGANWSEVRNVLVPADCPNGKPACVEMPRIAIGPDRSDAKIQAIYAAYVSEAQNTLRLVRVADQESEVSVGVGPSAYGDVEVTDAGIINIVSLEGAARRAYGNSENLLLFSRSEDGGKSFLDGRGSPKAPGESLPYFFGNPQVATDSRRGLTYVAYTSGTEDGKWDIQLATSSDAGVTWTRTRVNDDAPCANHRLPTLAIDPAFGDVYVGWMENRSGAGQVAIAKCDSGGAKCGANSLISDVPWSTYSLSKDTSKSPGESWTLTLDDKNRKLHAIWAQPVRDAAGEVTRLFAATAALKARPKTKN